MKKIYILLLAVVCCTFTSCGDDEWDNGDPAMEHIYYFGFENWGQNNNEFNNNKVQYTVEKGTTVEIPVQFQSERVRSYDVTVYYYALKNDTIQRGVHYQITDEKGTVLEPDANGAFSMTFPQAKKGVKNIYLKSLNDGKPGAFDLMTFDPNAGEIAHPDNITNSQTKDYEVRAFTRNYKVKVNVK